MSPRPQAQTLSGSPQPNFIGYSVAPVIAKRDPRTTDTGYPFGQQWVNKSTSSVFFLAGVSAGVATWSSVTAGSGSLNSLNSVAPVGGNINLVGTGSEITVTPGVGIVTVSFPGSMATPGSLSVATSLLVGTDLTVSGNASIAGTLTFGSLVDTGNYTLGSSSGSVGILGNNLGATSIALHVGTGNFLLDGAASSTIAIGTGLTSGTITIGDTGMTGTSTITLGNSNSSNTILIGNGSGDTTVKIANATAGANIVDICDGINVALQTVNIGSGPCASDMAINVVNGAMTAGTHSVNILSGNSTGSTDSFKLADGTGAVNIKIGTGDTGVKTIAIGGTAANVITIGNTQTTGSIALANAMTTGTVAIGGTAGQGLITIGGATNATGQKVSIQSGASIAGPNSVDILAGLTPAGNQTLSIMTGQGTAGTYAVNILTGNSTGTTQSVSIGTGSARTDITLGGSGANVIAIGNTQTTGSFAVGNAMTSGTISLGGTAGTGLITIGGATNATGQTVSINSGASIAGTNIVKILDGATPAASQTFQLMTGIGTAGTYAVKILTGNSTGTTQTVEVGTGSARTDITLGGSGANVVAIANTQTAGSLSLAHAMTTGNIVIGDAQTSGTLTIGSIAAGAGTVRIVDGTGNQATSIATGAGNKTVIIGSTNGTSTLTLNAGTSITMVGNVLKTTNPAFLAYLAGSAANKTGNGTSYTLGTDALTEVYDRGSNFNTNGTFTAPVTGIYDLRAQVTITGATIATTFVIAIVTTARTYKYTFIKAAGAQDETVAVSAIADMTATNTATVTITVSGEAADTDDIKGGATLETYFCGCLVG